MWILVSMALAASLGPREIWGSLRIGAAVLGFWGLRASGPDAKRV